MQELQVIQFDDCGFEFEGIECRAMRVVESEHHRLDDWFNAWAKEYLRSEEDGPKRSGMFLIHAHGRISPRSDRQELHGIEILKHIRLTPWLRDLRTWHAIVYSFEPLEHILFRRPGTAIVLSEGVTFLRLPDCVSLKGAIADRFGAGGDYANMTTGAALLDLARRRPATVSSTHFRSFVAADYEPPDSAHDISNVWGIYEICRCLVALDRSRPASTVYPEIEEPDMLPRPVQAFVTSLEGKRVRFLHSSATPQDPEGADLLKQVEQDADGLLRVADGRTVVYVDDEASKGWKWLLARLLVTASPSKLPGCKLVLPPTNLLQLNGPGCAAAAQDTSRERIERRIEALVDWILQSNPDALILDLRLLGSVERDEPADRASGFRVASEIRRQAPYLPILLFTASNKADTVLTSRDLDVDDYWMKPGVGEHRSARGGGPQLRVLVNTLTFLLGSEYRWLRRVGIEAGAIAQAPNKYWWERKIDWPVPTCIGARRSNGSSDMYFPPPDVRARVVALLHSILYTIRIRLRLSREARGSALNYERPEQLALTLKLAVFNWIGQTVELIHGTEDGDHVEGAFIASTSNGRVGGFRRVGSANRARPDGFVFRRLDWIAFRLFALRNEASHFSRAASASDVLADESLMLAVSDLIAWLTVERAPVAPLDSEQLAAAEDLMRGTDCPVLPLHPDDADCEARLTAVASLKRSNNDYAVLNEFRRQLAMRPGIQEVIAKGDELMTLG